MKARTFDGEAVRLLLDGEPVGGPRLQALAAQAARQVAIACGQACPFCGSERVEAAHLAGGDTSGRCEACDEQWEITRDGRVQS